jgi:hypothetical protein
MLFSLFSGRCSRTDGGQSTPTPPPSDEPTARDRSIVSAALSVSYPCRSTFEPSETWMTLEADFLTSAADKLAENVDRIEACLAKLPPHALWARDSENENAVGNLLLHLEGNVRQWLLSGIGAGLDERDRPGEFSARTGADSAVLLAKLSAIFHVVEHFSGHTYQIILITKRFTGTDLGFYSYLDRTGRRAAAANASDGAVGE